MGILIIALALAALPATGCNDTPEHVQTKPEPTKAGTSTLVLGGGCFWCTEAVYEELRGVISVESGYAGGTAANPTYEQVCTGLTGHAEVVKVTFDPKTISAHDILSIFFTVHNPTTLNRQGPDSGTQYRSAIFYANDEEKALAQKVIDEVNKAKIWRDPIVTTLEPLKAFYKADESHQNYFDRYEKGDDRAKSSMNAGYCTYIIEPKIEKFRKQYADRLKK
jgi:peptide-methionine (S)-S-oxide reductase